MDGLRPRLRAQKVQNCWNPARKPRRVGIREIIHNHCIIYIYTHRSLLRNMERIPNHLSYTHPSLSLIVVDLRRRILPLRWGSMGP